jgi:hypothetical protein
MDARGDIQKLFRQILLYDLLDEAEYTPTGPTPADHNAPYVFDVENKQVWGFNPELHKDAKHIALEEMINILRAEIDMVRKQRLKNSEHGDQLELSNDRLTFRMCVNCSKKVLRGEIDIRETRYTHPEVVKLLLEEVLRKNGKL